MKLLLRIFTASLFFLIFSSTLIAHATNYHKNAEYLQGKAKKERIYVNPQQIEMTENAIIVWSLDGNDYILAKNIALDDKGLYIRPLTNQRGPCGLHTQWCNRCKGCGVLLCPMNCTCYD